MIDINTLKFPFYLPTEDELNNLLEDFIRHDKWNSDRNSLFVMEEEKGNMIRFNSNRLGITYLWSFFNWAWSSIKCNNTLTPIDIFNDKALLKDLLKDYDSITDEKFRELLRGYPGVQTISNFRPTTAQCIYDIFLRDIEADKTAVVWDPCAGFGGRMLGAIKSEKVGLYIADEPSIKTYVGLNKVLDNIKKQDSLLNTTVDIHNSTMENDGLISKLENRIDMVFTSPPYYDVEKYTNEDTQSFIKFNTKQKWLEGFLRVLCMKAYKCLKYGGKFILNINATSNFKDLHYSAVNLAIYSGFKLNGIHKYMLESRNIKGERFEPIFEFEK